MSVKNKEDFCSLDLLKICFVFFVFLFALLNVCAFSKYCTLTCVSCHLPQCALGWIPVASVLFIICHICMNWLLYVLPCTCLCSLYRKFSNTGK